MKTSSDPRLDRQRGTGKAALRHPAEKISVPIDHEAEPPIETGLRRWSIAATLLGVLLAALGGINSWRSARQASASDDWVAHSHAVNAALEVMLVDVVQVESSAHGFAATGDKGFLNSFDASCGKLGHDFDSLNALTADNALQQERLRRLQTAVEARVATAQEKVNQREQTGRQPAAALFLLGKRRMDTVRAIIEQMQAEEARLLQQRTLSAEQARQKTLDATLLSTLVGILLLLFAGIVTRREIGRSGRMRTRVETLNAELESRFTERTVELRESQERLKGIIESAMDAIVTIDEDHKIVLFNAAAETIFQCPSATAVGQPLDRFIPERFRAGHNSILREFASVAISTRQIGTGPSLYGLRSDGTEFPLEASISRIQVGGKMLFTAIARDVTERKQAEAALRQSEETIRLFIEHAPAALAMFDRDMCYLQASRRWRQDYGLGDRDLTGLSHYDLFPDISERWKEVHRRGFAGEVLREENDRFERADGSVQWIRWEVRPWYDAAGKIGGIVIFAEDVTENKLAQDALRESHARLKKVLEVETVGVMFWELSTGRLADANDTFLRTMGYNRQDLEAGELTWQRLTPPEYVEASLAELKKFAASGRVGPYEKEYFHKDGSRQWLLFAGSSLGGNSCVEFCVDISDRKKAEAALRESEERFQAMVNGIPQLAWMAEPDGHIFWYNQRWFEYTGTTLKDMEGWGWQSVHNPETLPAVLERWTISVRDGRPFDMEFPIRGADGIFHMFLTRVLPLKDSEGRVVRWFGTNTDISELKRAEEKVRDSQARLSAALASMTDAVIITDAEGRFLQINDGLTNYYRFKSKTECPNSLDSLRGIIEPLDETGVPLPIEEWPLARALRGEAGANLEYKIRRKDTGECWFGSYSVAPIREDSGPIVGAILVARDITEKRAAEQEIRLLNTDLERRVEQRTAQLQEANEEMEAFTYSVSHDLRAPLRHINGFSRMLIEEFGATLPPQAHHYVDRIADGTRRMGMLVDDLLHLGRVGRKELHLQATGLRSLVDEIVAELQPDCKDREVQWRIGPLPFVDCDPGLLKQALQNLLSNALKFTRPRNPAVIEVGQQCGAGSPAIYVRDNGVGFSMKYADKLFGVFQRLHRQEDFEGTGVGLATVQRIIKKHGGRIWVEADLDKGATFYFTLAASEKPAPLEKSASVGGNS